jgi:hypothetical protein
VHYPAPDCVQMERDLLDDYLPDQVKKIGPDARKQQLAARRHGALKRFAY